MCNLQLSDISKTNIQSLFIEPIEQKAFYRNLSVKITIVFPYSGKQLKTAYTAFYYSVKKLMKLKFCLDNEFIYKFTSCQ